MLGQFTNATTQTAMNNFGANKRTDAQIQSSNYQAGLQRDMMSKQFSLTHALNLGNQDMAWEAQRLGQLNADRNFTQAGTRDANANAYQTTMADAAKTTANNGRSNANTSAYATMVAPGEERKIKTAAELADAGAGWDMHSQEIESLLASPDNAKYAKSLNAWKDRINGWKTGTNSAGYLRAFRASRLSNPQMLLGTAVAPENKFPGN